MGCLNNTCDGYELMANLDFDTNGSRTADSGDAYWNNGAGWEPIGTSSNDFTAKFNGRGHTIYNLFINRNQAAYVGLFGDAWSSSELRNVGLVDVNVTVFSHVGALAGDADSTPI